MPDAAPHLAFARVGQALLARSADPGAADGWLLGRFAETGDAEAFAGLVARHGPMVLAVCRRAAGDAHLADDAFQATFLILARRACDVRPREAVRAFLYGVAVRTARTAKARSDRRLRREAPVSSVPDRLVPERPDADPDALRILDEEIARLPDRLRVAVVLCELDGLSRKDAAARLGVPEGTVSSRLAAARKTLAARLRARGVTAPAAGLGLLFAQLARSGTVPPRLTEAAARLATTDAVPADVTELTREAFKTMFLSKLTAVATAVALLAGGLVAASFSNPAPIEKPPVPVALVPASRPAPVPKAQAPREGVLAVTSFNKEKPLELFKPDGTSIRVPAVGEANALWEPRLSPDGKRLAGVRLGPIPQDAGDWTPNHLFILDLDAKEGPTEPLLSDMGSPHLVWSRDGVKLYGSQIEPAKLKDPIENDKPPAFVSWVYDPATKTKTPLALPAGQAIQDISPDGKTLLTVTWVGRDIWAGQTHLVPLDTLKPRPLTEKSFKAMRFSPDGKWVLGLRLRPKDVDPAPGLFVVSVADGSERQVKLPAEVAGVYHACWSPDGKRIAYQWNEEIPQPPGTPVPAGDGPHKWYASRVTVADADGGNAKLVIRREYSESITGLDWR